MKAKVLKVSALLSLALVVSGCGGAGGTNNSTSIPKLGAKVEALSLTSKLTSTSWCVVESQGKPQESMVSYTYRKDGTVVDGNEGGDSNSLTATYKISGNTVTVSSPTGDTVSSGQFTPVRFSPKISSTSKLAGAVKTGEQDCLSYIDSSMQGTGIQCPCNPLL